MVVTVTTRRKAPGQRRWRLGGELGASMRLRLSPAVLPCWRPVWAVLAQPDEHPLDMRKPEDDLDYLQI